jgi:hypothetical protein
MAEINLATPLSTRAAFAYPLQSRLAKREVVIGALWLLVPVIGWILNMGHRIMMVHNMQHGRSPWPSWKGYGALFKHGLFTFLGMIEYHLPAMLVEYFAWQSGNITLHAVAIILWIVATITVPGYMSHYCYQLDPSEIFNPFKACRRVFQAGVPYWKAWRIALSALAISFIGLLAFGIGFLITSVWFWQVAGFSFATVFTQKFRLDSK